MKSQNMWIDLFHLENQQNCCLFWSKTVILHAFWAVAQFGEFCQTENYTQIEAYDLTFQMNPILSLAKFPELRYRNCILFIILNFDLN